jgi:hypothetical protein
MEYAHPAYLVPQMTNADLVATTAFQAGRFAAWATMICKSAQCTVVVAGTDTVIPTITFRKINGTSTTTIGTANMSTQAIGYTTNVLFTNGTYAVGDFFVAVKGADATGVFAVGVEWLIQPGVDVTA